MGEAKTLVPTDRTGSPAVPRARVSNRGELGSRREPVFSKAEHLEQTEGLIDGTSRLVFFDRLEGTELRKAPASRRYEPFAVGLLARWLH
jgi:hypothetical protein